LVASRQLEIALFPLVLAKAIQSLDNQGEDGDKRPMSDLSRIIARIAEIKTIQAGLSTELEELAITQRVLTRLGAAANAAPRMAQSPSPQRKPRAGTTRDLFLEVLAQNADPWMTAGEVRSKALASRGTEIPMGTVSPTLTDLKNARLIVREGMKVALASRVLNNSEASTAETVEASMTSDSGSEALFRETAGHAR
jgi:hypothetical protein